MKFPFRRNKSIVHVIPATHEQEVQQELNARIVTCPHYSSIFPGTIFCRKKGQVTTLAACKACVTGREH